MVFEADIVRREHDVGHGGRGVCRDHICWIEEREESAPCWVELVVSGFQKDGSIGRGEEGVVEERTSFLGVTCGGLFDEDMFTGLKGFEGPFKM